MGASLAARRMQSLADNIPTQFQKVEFLRYTAVQNKQYRSTREFKRRMKNWTASDNFITERNYMQTEVVYGHNWLSDLSAREKKKLLPVRKVQPLMTSAR